MLDRVTVLGASGQVGRALIAELGSHHCIALPREAANLTGPAGLPRVLDHYRPSIVVNAAAYTQVDQAEKEESVAAVVNAQAPGVLASWCASHDVPFVHYSTDYVFSGEGTRPWREDDRVGPLSAYGRSKLAGERLVAEAGGRFLILRTSWVYDEQGKNFLRTMLRLGAQHETLRVVSDQYGAPTFATHLARGTIDALTAALAKPAFPSGVYHLCNRGETTWHGFAEAIFAGARAGGAKLKVSRVEAIPTAEYPTPARRPLNSRLDTSKAESVLGVKLPDWRAGLAECLEKVDYESF